MPSENTIYRVCSYLRNFFNRSQSYYSGKVTIVNGALSHTYGLSANQFFLIDGSTKNDGVHLYPITTLEDESFNGVISGMGIPKAVIEIMDKIEAWEAKYSSVDSVNMSPYNSESIGGFYSYNKSSGGSGDTSKDKSGTWQGVFAAELSAWRKI